MRRSGAENFVWLSPYCPIWRRQRLAMGRPFDEAVIWTKFREVSSALRYMHAQVTLL